MLRIIITILYYIILITSVAYTRYEILLLFSISTKHCLLLLVYDSRHGSWSNISLIYVCVCGMYIRYICYMCVIKVIVRANRIPHFWSSWHVCAAQYKQICIGTNGQ